MFACLAPLVGLAQGLDELAGGRSGGLAHGSVALTDVWAACHNPGALILVEGPAVGLCHEQRYFLPDLGISSLAAVYPFEGGALGLSFGTKGTAEYQVLRSGLAYAHSFSHGINAGIKLTYLREQIPEPSKNRQHLMVSGGGLIKLNETLKLGMVFSGPLSHQGPGIDLFRSLHLRIGLSYRISEELLLVSELNKQPTRRESWRSGLEYCINEQIIVRSGIATGPIRHSLGLGFRYASYSCDISFEYLHSLGSTANLSLQYAFER